MKRLFLFLFSWSVILTAFCQGTDTMVYDPGRKLTWKDFKGNPAYSDRSKGAQIMVSINLKVKKVSFWTGKPTYDAFAIAFQDQSWVKKAYKDDYTLAHEQLHFDIAHIYAETLEIELNSLMKQGGRPEEVENMLRKSTRAMRDYQALYDQETRGGNNRAKQKEWANRVQTDLQIIN
jgi:Bacterial protein of unknown function (DUF922)